MTPWARTSQPNGNSNATAFDFVCMHTERQPSLRLMSLSILILLFNAFLCLWIISLGELVLPSLILDTESRLQEKGYGTQLCVFLALSPLHCFSVCTSLHTFICAFLS